MSTSTNNMFEFGVHHNGIFKLTPLTYEHGSLLNINVPEMDYQQMLTYISTKLTCLYYATIQVYGLYYKLPPNNMVNGMKSLHTNHDVNIMYDIAKAAGKLEIYVSHHPIDLTTALVPEDGSFEDSFASIISEETKLKQQEALSYLHQMKTRKNKNPDYYDYVYSEFNFLGKQKPITPYTQTRFDFLVHNHGQLVIDETNNTNYVNGGQMTINIPRMKLQALKQYFNNIVDKQIHALYYKVPHRGFSSTVKLRNNYDMHVMFDISAAKGKLEIYIDHERVNFIIHKHIISNDRLARMMCDVITDYKDDSEEEKRESTQNDFTIDQMVEWAEQEHFQNEETKSGKRPMAISNKRCNK